MERLVSVVIPSYNHARYLGPAISSVLEQTHRNLELIVIDDGSSDESPEILRSVRDPRMRFVQQENAGAPAAINRGMALAQGELVSILNSDDRFAPQRLTRAAAAFAEDGELVLWGSWLEIIGAGGERLGTKQGYLSALPFAPEVPERTFQAEDDLRLNLLMSNYWATTSNYVFRRGLPARIGAMKNLRFAHDWDFALRAQRQGAARLERELLLQYRVHGANTITSNRVAMIFEVLWVLAVHLPGYLGDGSMALDGGEGTLLRAVQLRHSLHVHGCWRTFALLQAWLEAARAQGTALPEALLEEQNPVRCWLLDEIAAELKERERPAAEAAPSPAGLRESLRRLLWNARPSR